MRIGSLCVYCGSSLGRSPGPVQSARVLGRLLAARNVQLVYGGASIGVMGAIADEVLRCGGRVVGVIPQALVDKEVAHHGLTELIVTGSMHERKARMAELSDAFVALPGGVGTLEELFEIWTWAQLGLHRKPCGVLNVDGYFDGLIAFLDHAAASGFIRPSHRAMLQVAHTPDELLAAFERYEPPAVSKWVALDET